jgi:hypothetical protein
VPVEAFERRRAQGFWSELRQTASAWDMLIAEFNAAAGLEEGC